MNYARHLGGQRCPVCQKRSFHWQKHSFIHSLIYHPVDFPWPDTPWPWATCAWMGIQPCMVECSSFSHPPPKSLHFSPQRVWGGYNGIKHGPWSSDICLRETAGVLPTDKGPGQGKAGQGQGRGVDLQVVPAVLLRKVPGRQSRHSKQQVWRPTAFFFCPD